MKVRFPPGLNRANLFKCSLFVMISLWLASFAIVVFSRIACKGLEYCLNLISKRITYSTSYTGKKLVKGYVWSQSGRVRLGRIRSDLMS